MKKIMISLVAIAAMITMASANGGDAEFCFLHPDSPICGSVGPVGPTGADGIDGKDGIDGEDGRDGVDGIDGIDGVDGVAGQDGLDGRDGADGAKGDTGAVGDRGDNGNNGADGNDGADGVDFNSYYYQQTLNEFIKYAKEATEYYEDAAAGAAAIGAIDFGTTCEGQTEGGIGIGHSSSFSGSSTVGAVGIKHGITDTEAFIVKGWMADSDAYAIGAAMTHRF